jgi:hypothetical protein
MIFCLLEFKQLLLQATPTSYRNHCGEFMRQHDANRSLITPLGQQKVYASLEAIANVSDSSSVEGEQDSRLLRSVSSQCLFSPTVRRGKVSRIKY